MNSSYKLGERLTELMSERGISAKELATAIGAHYTTVYDWKNNASIRLSHVLRLTEYFSCSIEFMIGRTEKVIDFIPHKCPPLYDRVKQVLEERGVKITEIDQNTSIKDGYFSRWKQGYDVYIETLIELADYLGVTIDYLVGRER